jgi:GT2 family glycosyltransferase
MSVPTDVRTEEVRSAMLRQGPRLGVCVVNYRSRALIAGLIESLAAARGTTVLQIACVDNSESDTEFNGLRQLESRAAQLGILLTVTRSPSNVGYAAGNNAAARLLISAGVQSLLVVNPDVTVWAGTLDTLCRLVSARPSIYTVQTAHGSDSYNGLSQLNRWTSASSQATARQRSGALHSGAVIYPGGHFLAMTASTWLQLGGFCEDFFLFGEEADLAVRATDAGIAIGTTDLITVTHEVGATTGATAVVARKTTTTLRQASRSAVIFSRKHNGYRTTTVVLSRLLLGTVVCCRLGGPAARDVLGGIISGLRAPLSTPEPGAVQCSSR